MAMISKMWISVEAAKRKNAIPQAIIKTAATRYNMFRMKNSIKNFSGPEIAKYFNLSGETIPHLRLQY